MTTYYVSTSGSDSNSGTTTGSPFATLAAAQEQSLNPGDSILLNGGESFTGPLTIPYAGQVNGTSQDPITIGSYGTGQATINVSSGGPCIFIGGASYITIQDLILTGNTSYPGIAAYKTTAGLATGLVIDNVTASGGEYGIEIVGDSGGGWSLVSITDCVLHGNLNAGLAVSGPAATTTPAYAHKQFTITGVQAYSNAGNASNTSAATGLGIQIGSLNSGTITDCTTYSNGADNGATSLSPAGIQLYNCIGVAVTGCISYSNTSGTSALAAGYDLDYNCTNCRIANCVAYSNTGPGIMALTTQSNTAHSGNVINENLTWLNSGGAASYGEFYTSGAVLSLNVSNNTFVGRTTSSVNPPCVVMATTGLSGAVFSNNAFLQKSTGSVIVAGGALTTANALFSQNAYELGGTNYVTWNSTNYTTISAWTTAVTGQEPGAYFTGVLS